MVEEILADLKARLEAAKKELEKLDKLIAIAEDAGEDVTQYKIERNALAKKIEMWENAINKHGR